MAARPFTDAGTTDTADVETMFAGSHSSPPDRVADVVRYVVAAEADVGWRACVSLECGWRRAAQT